MNRLGSWNRQVVRTISPNNRSSFVLRVAQRRGARVVAAVAPAGLVLTPAFPAGISVKKTPAGVSRSLDAVSSFPPANADPKLAAALAGKGLALTDFKFTPAPAKGRPSQVRVAIRARVVEPVQTRVADASLPTAAVNSLTPSGYNLGVAVGWRRFAVAGGRGQAQNGGPGGGGGEGGGPG